jgi:hypothetical protein
MSTPLSYLSDQLQAGRAEGTDQRLRVLARCAETFQYTAILDAVEGGTEDLTATTPEDGASSAARPPAKRSSPPEWLDS